MTLSAPPTLQARDGARLAVRLLTAIEVEALRRFDAGLSAATRAFFLPHAYNLETLRGYVERNRRSEDRSYVLGAAQEVAGYFFLWEFDRPVPLLGLGLADAWQGRGLGGQMLRILIADARAAGCEGVELTTVTTNTRAFRLYASAGFHLLGEVENVAGDGRVVREYRMFLALKPGARPPVREFKPPL